MRIAEAAEHEDARGKGEAIERRLCHLVEGEVNLVELHSAEAGSRQLAS